MVEHNIKFDIVKQVGQISKSPKGWTKELNLISWNGARPKYDLRDWSPDHETLGKGLTLTEEELIELKKILDTELNNSEDKGEGESS